MYYDDARDEKRRLPGFEEILFPAVAAMNERPGSAEVSGMSPYELWYTRKPVCYPDAYLPPDQEDHPTVIQSPTPL